MEEVKDVEVAAVVVAAAMDVVVVVCGRAYVNKDKLYWTLCGHTQHTKGTWWDLVGCPNQNSFAYLTGTEMRCNGGIAQKGTERVHFMKSHV